MRSGASRRFRSMSLESYSAPRYRRSGMISQSSRPVGLNALHCLDGPRYIVTKVRQYSGEVLPPEPYVPTLEELQAAKKREISQACENAIYSGVDVNLSDGSTEHFSLTEHDQLNLFGKQVQLAAGTTELEYHADGQPCRYYTAEDMQIITSTAMAYVSYHTTYCNAVNMWIAGCETTKEVQQIYYGAEIPEQYQSDVLKAYIATEKERAGDVDEPQVTK